MAPPRRYALPNEQLLEELVYCRELGMGFAAAWDRAVRPGRAVILTNAKVAPEGAVRWPTDSNDRIAWRGAILETRDVWRRMYEGRTPTRREIAVTVLVDVLMDAADRRAERQSDRRRDHVGPVRGIGSLGAVRSVA